MLDVILFCLCLCSLSGVFSEFMSVTEGESVTLSMSLNVMQRKQGISWKFGAQEFLIAEITRGDSKVVIYEGQANGRFRDRLTLDQTGSLTITKTRITDSGLYEVSNTSTNTKLKIFHITVYAYLPVPVITNSSSSVSKCSVLCSVVNVSHVSLSWYKGSSLLSSISVSDLIDINSISLHLDCVDDSYLCVVKNPISNQTQHLTTDLCQPCAGSCSCGFSKAVIRLVVSALVGVATVAVLVYDITFRREEQKKKKRKRSEQFMESDIQLSDQ